MLGDFYKLSINQSSSSSSYSTLKRDRGGSYLPILISTVWALMSNGVHCWVGVKEQSNTF